MASNHDHFVTHWRVEGTVEEVSAVLDDAPSLAGWWAVAYLDAWEIRPGDARGVGREIGLSAKDWPPYTRRWQFRVTESRYQPGFSLDAMGDLVG